MLRSTKEITDKQRDGETDRQIDRQTEKHRDTDRETDRETEEMNEERRNRKLGDSQCISWTASSTESARVILISARFSVSNTDLFIFTHTYTISKGSPILETSVGFRSRFRSSAVSPQVTKAINPVVGCHYFPPGPQ